jgi:hypothetical protein
LEFSGQDVSVLPTGRQLHSRVRAVKRSMRNKPQLWPWPKPSFAPWPSRQRRRAWVASSSTMGMQR